MEGVGAMPNRGSGFLRSNGAGTHDKRLGKDVCTTEGTKFTKGEKEGNLKNRVLLI